MHEHLVNNDDIIVTLTCAVCGMVLFVLVSPSSSINKAMIEVVLWN